MQAAFLSFGKIDKLPRAYRSPLRIGFKVRIVVGRVCRVVTHAGIEFQITRACQRHPPLLTQATLAFPSAGRAHPQNA